MIKIDFNSNTIETSCKNLHSLLKEQQLQHKTGIAVAVNNQVVSKTNWDKTPIYQNDSILVITATQGG